MKIGVLGLAGLLLLTGCASTPSLEDQTKLLEYEKCIDFLLLQNQDTNPGYLGYEDLIEFYEAIRAESCASYRP
jgi:predicted component of type VI protein secretion system